jgi:hypothetical protein
MGRTVEQMRSIDISATRAKAAPQFFGCLQCQKKLL